MNEYECRYISVEGLIGFSDFLQHLQYNKTSEVLE